MFLQLDGQGPQYAQLTRALKSALLEGRVREGEQLPPTRQLAAELGVARNTVLAAYDQLRAEGFLQGRAGRGSIVVAARKAERGARGAEEGPIAPTSRYVARARKLGTEVYSQAPQRVAPRYNLQYGAPFINPTLTAAWSRALAHAARHCNPAYAVTQGLPALRAAVCDYLARRRGVAASPEDVIIVSGAQQALSLCARVLLDDGDVAAIEEPHYFGARQVFEAHGARILPIPVDEQGLVTDALPARAPKLIFTTPSHQFPSGVTLSLPRRLALLRYAQTSRAWILEDDYDGEFRYDARPLAALRSLDTTGRAIYIGSFSKTLFPTLRLGYVVVPPSLRDDFTTCKWLMDLSCPGVEQRALATFMADGHYERHLRYAARELKRRRAALLAGLEPLRAQGLRLLDSQAGMHLSVWLDGWSAAQVEHLIETARARELRLFSLIHYFIRPPGRPGLLFGYAGTPLGELNKAMQIFRECFAACRPRVTAGGSRGVATGKRKRASGGGT